MLYLILPVGSRYGWGVCGMNLVLELSRLTTVRHLGFDFSAEDIGDESTHQALQALRAPGEEVRARVAAPVLQTTLGNTLHPASPGFRGCFDAAYAVFEEDVFPPGVLTSTRERFDLVVTGSRWGEEVLRAHGLDRVATVIHGVDPHLFNVEPIGDRLFGDRFTVFSGGKLELRKGQDLVTRAFKVLQDRHPDVLLVTSWWNPWPATTATMAASPHVRWPRVSGDSQEIASAFLAENGIDLDRVVVLPPRLNAAMAEVYKSTDVGLFPNRCEGATNLVLMEYMACGRPAIASFATGHRDVLTADNAILLERGQELAIVRNGREVAAHWWEPDLDEAIARLEWAYQHRDELARIGRRAGEDMARHTWRRTAERFLELLTRS